MGPIEEALREKCFPSLFGGEEITADFRKILGHRVKHGGLGVETTVNLTDSPVLRLSNLKLVSSCVQFDFTNI